MLVGAVERLIALCLRVPAHANGQNMRVGRERREIELQALFRALLVLQPPAGYGCEWSQTEKTLLVFEVLIAAQQFRPFAVGIFRHDYAGDDGSRQIVGWGLWHDVGHKKLLLAVFREVSERQHLRFAAQQRSCRQPNLFRYGRLGGVGFRLPQRLWGIRTPPRPKNRRAQDTTRKF